MFIRNTLIVLGMGVGLTSQMCGAKILNTESQDLAGNQDKTVGEGVAGSRLGISTVSSSSDNSSSPADSIDSPASGSLGSSPAGSLEIYNKLDLNGHYLAIGHDKVMIRTSCSWV